MSNTRKFAYKQFQFSEEQLNLIKKYSQQELIKMTGLSQSIISELLANLPKDYRISTFVSLSEGFGMTLEEFIALGGPIMSKDKARKIEPLDVSSLDSVNAVTSEDKQPKIVNKQYGHY